MPVRGESERQRRQRKRGQNRVDVQTELDTIRKSILRRWYAVKIILVSAATRRVQGAGGDQKGEREVRGEGRGRWDRVLRHKDSSFWHKSKPLVCVHMARTDSHCPLCVP